MHAQGGEERGLSRLALVCVLLTVALGVTKVFVQRVHLPSYASPTYNTYEGFVSVDQYCIRAEKMRDRMTASGAEVEGAQAEMMKDLRQRGHPSAILVPAVIALASLLVGSIPITFMALAILAFLFQVVVVRKLAACLSGGHAATVAIATILVAAHCDTVRTSAQLLLDPFAALFTTLAVWLSLRRHDDEAGSGTTWALVAVQVLGPFIKLSYLPALAAPAVVTLFVAREGRLRGAVLDALRFGALPVLPAVAFVLAVPTLEGFGKEMNQALDASSTSLLEYGDFAFEVVLMLLPLLVFLRRPRAGSNPAADGPRGATGAVLATLAVLVASMWALRLPDVSRLALPLVGLIAAVSAPRAWSWFGPGRAVAVLALYAALNYAVAVAALVVGVMR